LTFLGQALFVEPLMSGYFFSDPSFHNTELPAGQGGMETVKPPVFAAGVPAQEKP
jgi:hypothetical protein